jgi:Methyltransferase domain
MSGMRSIISPAGTGFTLFGVNADLWEAAESLSGTFAFLTPARRKLFARALGAPEDNKRVEASKTLIQDLWSAHRELGPYPFLNTLSEFEFGRYFYPGYRDHVCHQLKVFVLGLTILDRCSSIREHVSKLLGDERDLALVWLVTAVFHDLGYVIENDTSQPGTDPWDKVTSEYAKVMTAPLSALPGLKLTSAIEAAIQGEHDVSCRTSLGQAELQRLDIFDLFAEEAERSGLGNSTTEGPAIKRYYDYAQTTDSQRPKFRDHGVASAMLLMKHWSNFDAYVDKWTNARAAISLSHPHVDLSQLSDIRDRRRSLMPRVRRAAGAMSLHNIAPQMWHRQWADAASGRYGLDFQRFRICLRDTSEHRANGLAFLLGLVDTLQDWDRPTFGETPKPGSLQGADLSISVDGDRERVMVYVKTDDLEFRDPSRAPRSRYSQMVAVLKEYLDPTEVDSLVEWHAPRSLSAVDPSVADARSDDASAHSRGAASVRRIIQLLQDDESALLEKIFLQTIPQSLVQWLKPALASCGADARERMATLLGDLYASRTSRSDLDATFVRQTCCYLLCFLNTPYSRKILVGALDSETATLVRRGIYLGLIIAQQSHDHLSAYLNELHTNENAACVNAGYYQCYYGDKFFPEGYQFDQKVSSASSINAVIGHLDSPEHQFSLAIDIFTLTYIISRSAVSALTPAQRTRVDELLSEASSHTPVVQTELADLRAVLGSIQRDNLGGGGDFSVREPGVLKRMLLPAEMKALHNHYRDMVYIDGNFFPRAKADAALFAEEIARDRAKADRLATTILDWPFLKDRSRVLLDLGCSYGAFVDAWKVKSGANAMGVDISGSAIALGTQLFPTVALSTQDAMVLKLDLMPDIVSCFDFIEHCFDIDLLLFRLCRAIDKNVMFVVYVPIIDTVAVSHLRTFKYHYREHVYYFSEDGLLAKMKQFGLVPVHKERPKPHKLLAVFQKTE